jgi:hypothetical protein
MKKILLGVAAAFALGHAVPAFADDAPKADAPAKEEGAKKAKKGGKKAKKGEDKPAADAPAK